jgi:hypothetical protein
VSVVFSAHPPSNESMRHVTWLLVMVGCQSQGEGASPETDLALAASVSLEPTRIAYAMTVTNRGPAPLEAELAELAFEIGGTLLEPVTGDGACTSGACTLGELDVDQAASFAFVTGLLDSQLSASVTVLETDPIVENNAIELVAAPSADLAMSITESGDPVAGGGSLRYVATVENLGPTHAFTVTVQLAVTGCTITSLTGAGWICDVAQASCARESHAVGSSAIGVNTTASASGEAELRATVESDDADPDPANNTAVETTTIVP